MNLAFYCDDSSDVLILSLITQFNVGGLPTLNLANACTGTFLNGTNLLKCDQVGEGNSKERVADFSFCHLNNKWLSSRY